MIKWFKRKSPSIPTEETDLVIKDAQETQETQKALLEESSAKSSLEKNNEFNTPTDLGYPLPNNPLSHTDNVEEAAPIAKTPFFARFKKGLEKTRQQLGQGIRRLLLDRPKIDDALLEELETLLIRADVGIATSQMILDQLLQAVNKQRLSDGASIYQQLKLQLAHILQKAELPTSANVNAATDTTDPSPAVAKPHVILMVGVNGVGKTTSIGKLAKQFQKANKKVILAAGDTFRAAAIEQLQIWGERHSIPVIAQHSGADSASVIYDALQAAKARDTDILIADTAGRLHTQSHLMDELKKIKRVLKKLDPEAPHETLLVLDATTGQNALNQARQFHEAIGLTGIIMTKLDGTAKGGILFTIAHELKLPIRYIGIGEQVEDLRPFNAEQFVSALFND